LRQIIAIVTKTPTETPTMHFTTLLAATTVALAKPIVAFDFWIAYNLESNSYCAGSGGCTGGSNQYVFLSNGEAQPGCVQWDKARPKASFNYSIKWPSHFKGLLCNKEVDFYDTHNPTGEVYDFYTAGGDGIKKGRFYGKITGTKYCASFGGAEVIRGIAQCYYDSGAPHYC